MLISVIIPTCHRNDLLAKCLGCLAPASQTLDASEYEVIVTDDGSAATAREMIERDYPWARWLAGPRKGPAANRNHGAGHARGEWLVFVDDDCVPDRDLLAAYRRSAGPGGAAVLEGRTEAEGEKPAADFECPVNTSGGYLWSCNFAIRKSLYQHLCGFDESFPYAAMEDVELRWRLEDIEQQLHFVPEAIVKHPWKRRRGRSYARQHAESVAVCLQKHPERNRKFTLSNTLHNISRIIFRNFPRDLIHFHGRGALRNLALDVLSSALIQRAANPREARVTGSHPNHIDSPAPD